jgi:hypothetical protein
MNSVTEAVRPPALARKPFESRCAPVPKTFTMREPAGQGYIFDRDKVPTEGKLVLTEDGSGEWAVRRFIPGMERYLLILATAAWISAD